MKLIPILNSIRRSLIVSTAICAAGFACFAQNQSSSTQTSNPAFAQQVGATATEVTQGIQNTGQAAMTNIETLWKRIDEKRLKNRTPDEIVAWALMGLLVGGLLYRLTKVGQFKSLLVGLIGAFLGGIIANVFQIDWGWGPVLIRYEELFCSLLGGLALFYGVKWYTGRKPAKAPAPAK